MKDERWLAETDARLLMSKLHEEVGEMQHDFNRKKDESFLREARDTALILGRLVEVVEKDGIPETRPERYR
jgi:biotin-(acetyl-CoA carboxylase) ligase